MSRSARRSCAPTAPTRLHAGGESDVDLSLQRLAEIRAARPRRLLVPGQFDNADNVEAHSERPGPRSGSRRRHDRRVRRLAGQRRHADRRGRYLRERDARVRLSPSSPRSARCSRGANGAARHRGHRRRLHPRQPRRLAALGHHPTTTDESLMMARRLAAEEGHLLRHLHRCNVAAALKLAAAIPSCPRSSPWPTTRASGTSRPRCAARTRGRRARARAPDG